MEEKIRINLSKHTHDLLIKDAENFEFFKKDGSLNKNEFLNTLIIHYQNDYAKHQEESLAIIQKTLSGTSLKQSELEDFSYQILNKLTSITSFERKTNDIHIAFRPTKLSSPIVDFIENHELKGSSRSNYYRMMFDSYVSLPQDKRERIIFRDKVELIEKAILHNKKMYLQTKNDHKTNHSGLIINPYKLALTKEELYNYLLVEIEEKKTARSYRLCRIKSLSLLNETRSFKEETLSQLERIAKYGPQYVYQPSEKQPIIVQLTEEGQKDFKKFFLHRPVPVSVDNNLYAFDCSYMQLFHYFTRFGGHAFIAEPDELSNNMMNFYKSAYHTYQRKINKK